MNGRPVTVLDTRDYGFDVDRLSPPEPGGTLVRTLAFLGQSPPGELASACGREVWRWAQANWRPDRIPRVGSLRGD